MIANVQKHVFSFVFSAEKWSPGAESCVCTLTTEVIVSGHSARNILAKNPASYFWSRFGEKGNHGNGDEEQSETGKLIKLQIWQRNMLE